MGHKPVPNRMLVVPIVGHPGVGYETLVNELNGEARDSLGSRWDSQRPWTWYLDPTYVWNKALQESEKLTEPKYWSVGSENWPALLTLTWPKLVVLRVTDFDEWVRRAEAFRKKVGLASFTDKELDENRQAVTLENDYLDFVLPLRKEGSTLVVDFKHTPEELVALVRDYVSDAEKPTYEIASQPPSTDAKEKVATRDSRKALDLKIGDSGQEGDKNDKIVSLPFSI